MGHKPKQAIRVCGKCKESKLCRGNTCKECRRKRSRPWIGLAYKAKHLARMRKG